MMTHSDTTCYHGKHGACHMGHIPYRRDRHFCNFASFTSGYTPDERRNYHRQLARVLKGCVRAAKSEWRATRLPATMAQACHYEAMRVSHLQMLQTLTQWPNGTIFYTDDYIGILYAETPDHNIHRA